MAAARRVLEIGCPGTVPYGSALAWQEALVTRRLAGGPDALLLLEHPPVYTAGRGADLRHLRDAAAGSIPIWPVRRGGDVTYHGPGQLVGYPVLGLGDIRPDVHWYLRALEGALIAALADCGIAAGRVPGRTGVWVDGSRKIASIGIAVRRWVTSHGFALNVGPDLRGFDGIVPCGLTGVRMTSVAIEGGPSDPGRMLPLVRRRMMEAWGFDAWQPLDLDTMEARP